MAAAEGWSIIKTEENNNMNAPDSNSNVSSIKDYFDVIGELERKCRLCASTVEISANSNCGMKSHFITKHFTGLAKIEPALKHLIEEISNHFADNDGNGTIVNGEEIPGYFGLGYENIDPSKFEKPQKAGNFTFFTPRNAKKLPSIFEKITNENTYTASAGKKQFKFTHQIVDDSWDNNNGPHTSSDRFEPTDGMINATIDSFDSKDDEADPMIQDCSQICNKNCLTKDEFNIFGNFIATELRNMKTDEFRRKLKQAVQKCLLDLAVEEDATLAERERMNNNNS